MNFLAHYYLLNQKNNPDIVLGNLLPDLVRGFTKIYHQEIKNNKKLVENQIVKGINFHLKTDKIFHNSEFFINQNIKIKQAILQHGLPSKRYYITAHILLEVLIDQYLIKSNPSLGNNFYESLQKSEQSDILKKIDSIIKTQNNSKIIVIFKSFIENEYAFALYKNEGVKFAMNEIIGNRIGIDFTLNNWDLVINQTYNNLKVELPHFLNNINIKLENA